MGRPERRIVLQFPAVRSTTALIALQEDRAGLARHHEVMLAGQVAADPLPHRRVLRSNRSQRRIAQRAAVSKGCSAAQSRGVHVPCHDCMGTGFSGKHERNREVSRNGTPSVAARRAQGATVAVGRPDVAITEMLLGSVFGSLVPAWIRGTAPHLSEPGTGALAELAECRNGRCSWSRRVATRRA
jgi:hypothetical protein